MELARVKIKYHPELEESLKKIYKENKTTFVFITRGKKIKVKNVFTISFYSKKNILICPFFQF